MDRISDEQLKHLLETFARPISWTGDCIKSALTELRERRAADKRPCSFSQAFNEGDGTYRP
jgi:hypothetical protein